MTLIEAIQATRHHLEDNRVQDLMVLNNPSNQLRQGIHLIVKHRFYLQLVHRYRLPQVVHNRIHQFQRRSTVTHLQIKIQRKVCHQLLGLKITLLVVLLQAKITTIDPIRFVSIYFTLLF